MDSSIVRRFEDPDEVRVFEKGRIEIVHIGGLTIGRASYEPGWKWSEHVAPIAGSALCGIEHVGLVVSGCAVAAFQDGSVVELTAGQLFRIPAVPTTVGSAATQRMCRSISSARTAIRSSCSKCAGAPSDAPARGLLHVTG